MSWLRSDRVLLDGALRPAAIRIEGERIGEITEAPPPGAEVEELGDLVLAPGLVDCHVHVNEPGRTEWEGFETATRAAIAGGVTTLVDMPLNCIPVTTTPAALAAKLEACDGHLAADVGFWGGVVPDNAQHLAGLATDGALGAKAFLCHSGIDDFPKTEEAELRVAMQRLAGVGVPLLAHAELELDQRTCPSGARSYDAWLSARPKAWEDAAVELLIRLCRQTGCAVHVVHLSSATAIPMIRDAKAEGLPFTVETCPHYLCLAAEEVPEGATEYKCAPPIREAENRDALWQGLRDGVIDCVVTDHSPCTPALKHRDAGDFGGAWGGIASLSLGLSSVWTEASRRGVSLERVLGWMSAGPARLCGLTGRKGRIAKGADADLIAFDPGATRVICADDLRFRHPVSPYLGREQRGLVRATWLRGRRVHGEGATTQPAGRPILGREGTGR